VSRRLGRGVCLIGSASSPLRWILPGLALGGAALGLAWGRVLRIRRPDVHTGIGRSAVLAQDADDQGTDHIETLGARTTWRHTLASRHNLACAYLEAQRPTEAVVSASWVPLTRTR